MATDTRPGFRLPWAGVPQSDGAQTHEPAATDDAPVALNGQEAQVPQMIQPADTAEPGTSLDQTTLEAEPSGAAMEPGAELAASDSQPARRTTKFMAELSRAMQAAAETARAELMSRFEAEAKAVVEQVHTGATDEAAGLRRRADDDIAAIREWSKAEVARIREETDGRIAARKTGLETEMAQHAAAVEERIERVSAVVAAFEMQMAAFFEQLNAEEDPTRIATMAETMPEPPSLAEVAASIASAALGQPDATAATETSAEPVNDAAIPGGTATSRNETAAEIDFAAAEAEAAAFSGDLEGEDDLPAADAGPVGDPGAEAAASPEDTPAAELTSTRIGVSGLESVANIANFKRSLGRIPGVAAIAVASGAEGDFVFTVGHTVGSSLSAAIQELPGFDIQITGETDGAINVAAEDRDASG